jgi:hypothetical protein
VIKGSVRARQRIIDIDTAINHNGLPRCALIFDSELIAVRPRPMRAFQGWRYLEVANAPKDVTDMADQPDELPAQMAGELRELGLL